MTHFSESDDSLAGVVENHNIEVRDFMILSIICDQGGMSAEELCSALGLSRHSVADCVDRLTAAELVEPASGVERQPRGDAPSDYDKLESTSFGRLLSRRILGAQ